MTKYILILFLGVVGCGKEEPKEPRMARLFVSSPQEGEEIVGGFLARGYISISDERGRILVMRPVHISTEAFIIDAIKLRCLNSAEAKFINGGSQ